jgi:hypothetical protein
MRYDFYGAMVVYLKGLPDVHFVSRRCMCFMCVRCVLCVLYVYYVYYMCIICVYVFMCLCVFKCGTTSMVTYLKGLPDVHFVSRR